MTFSNKLDALLARVRDAQKAVRPQQEVARL